MGFVEWVVTYVCVCLYVRACLSLSFSLSLSLSLCVCVCVCVCVCARALILFHRGGFFWLQDVLDILQGYGSTMLCCEYHPRCFCQVPSSPFLNMSYFNSKDKSPARRKLERKKVMYIDKGYKSAHQQTDKWRKDNRDKEANLIYILPLWIKSLAFT